VIQIKLNGRRLTDLDGMVSLKIKQTQGAKTFKINENELEVSIL
jgi:hypothetical protein